MASGIRAHLYPSCLAQATLTQVPLAGGGVVGRSNLLADEQHVYSAEVKIVKKRQRGKPVVGRVLAGVQLQSGGTS